MATVTGLTAARMEEMEDATVVDGNIVGDDLILVTKGGTNINAGNVRGPQGVVGPAGPAIPPGVLAPYAGSTAPTGWLIAAGQAVSRSTYSALFTAISTAYGAGDGSTTFNLPDLRGRAPIALDNQNGTDAGRITAANTLGGVGGFETHTLLETQMPQHTHIQNSHNHSQTPHNHNGGNNFIVQYGPGGSGLIFPGEGVTPSNASGSNSTATNVSTIATNQLTGGGQAHNNLQPYILTLYIIKT